MRWTSFRRIKRLNKADDNTGVLATAMVTKRSIDGYSVCCERRTAITYLGFGLQRILCVYCDESLDCFPFVLRTTIQELLSQLFVDENILDPLWMEIDVASASK